MPGCGSEIPMLLTNHGNNKPSPGTSRCLGVPGTMVSGLADNSEAVLFCSSKGSLVVTHAARPFLAVVHAHPRRQRLPPPPPTWRGRGHLPVGRWWGVRSGMRGSSWQPKHRTESTEGLSQRGCWGWGYIGPQPHNNPEASSPSPSLHDQLPSAASWVTS